MANMTSFLKHKYLKSLKKSPTPFSKILIIVLAKGTIKPDEGDTRICISDWIFALGGIDSQPRSSDLQ